MIEADLSLMFRGSVKRLPCETLWVWDMGADALLSHATICEESLSLEPNPPEDEVFINQFVTRTGDFQFGQGESLLLEHLRERSRNGLVADLSTVAQLPPPSGHRIHPERLARMAASNAPIKEEPRDACARSHSNQQRCCAACHNVSTNPDHEQAVQDQRDESVLRDQLNGARGATHSRFDGMRFEEVLELRRS